eukprot:scaffold8324_cov17-Tisochrysis_lutea.AAC.2
MPALHAQYLLCSRVRLVPTIANGLLEAKLLASFNAPAVNVALSSPMTCGVNKCKCRTDDIESCFLRAVRIQFLCMRACVRACVTATRCCAQMNYSEQMKESSNTHDTLLQLPAPMATGIFLAANVCVCVPWPEVPTESKEQDLMGFRIAHVAFMILPTRRQQNNHFSLSRTKAAKKELCLYAEQLQCNQLELCEPNCAAARHRGSAQHLLQKRTWVTRPNESASAEEMVRAVSARSAVAPAVHVTWLDVHANPPAFKSTQQQKITMKAYPQSRVCTRDFPGSTEASDTQTEAKSKPRDQESKTCQVRKMSDSPWQ